MGLESGERDSSLLSETEVVVGRRVEGALERERAGVRERGRLGDVKKPTSELRLVLARGGEDLGDG